MSWGKSTKIRKYEPGPRMMGIFDLITAFDQGRYVFVRGKAYHPAVLRNWSLVSLEGACRYGDARVANVSQAWRDAEELKAENERQKTFNSNHAALDIIFGEVGE